METTTLPHLISYTTRTIAALMLFAWTPAVASAATVSGDLTKWHTVVVDFAGPTHDEMDSDPNPFLDYRLQVEFTSSVSGRVYNVPGFFDGDGNNGGDGNVWRVRFAPDEAGEWTYLASFRTGTDVAVDLSAGAGSPTSFDGEAGSFMVAPLDLGAAGFRRYGRLEWDGTHYLKFRDGGYWVKLGTNVPENFLGYSGFDNTPNAKIHFDAHASEWQAGDPAWDSPDAPDTNDARGIIGALNYLANENINSIYFMPMNIGADSEDTWPYADPDIDHRGSASNDNLHFDISKLAQWEAVLDHAQRKSIFLHFVLSDKEAANKNELDNATLGVERKLLYRELVARFGHHNALQWNISEEYNLELPLHPDVIKEFAGYINDIDPYEHPVTVHNHGNTYVAALGPFLGDDRFDLLSVQTWQRPDDIGSTIEYFREASTDAGRPIPVYVDESIGLDQIGADEYRKRASWDALLSGGGHELFNRIDWRLNDFTPYQQYFEDGWFARRFVEENLPFWNMIPSDDLVSGENSVHGGAEVLADEGEIYGIYLPQADPSPTLSMAGVSGEFEQHWYNPRSGQFEGPVTIFSASSSHDLGSPPNSSNEDWAILIRRPDAPDNIPPVAMNGVLMLDEDTTKALTLEAEDDDGDPLTFSIAMTPMHGSVNGSPPNLTYTPQLNYVGNDQLSFQVHDGRGGSDMGSVVIMVDAVNDRPTAANVAASTFAGVPVLLTLDGDDVDGDGLTYAVTMAPSGGTLSAIAGDHVTYTPNPGFSGPDSFEYTADDGSLESTAASVDINVIPSTGSNILFADDFGRADASEIGNGWTQLEQAGAALAITSGELRFVDCSDKPMRPLASHPFPGLSNGILTWSFDMDWTRDRKEGTYAVYMQLGEGSAMNDSDTDSGIGVSLVWSRIGGVHQMLGYTSGGSTTAIAPVSGSTAVSVAVDLDTDTFSVAIDESIVAEALPLGSVGTLDTVRYLTDGLNEVYFSGRTFDNVMITTDLDDPDPDNTDPVANADSVVVDENSSTAIVLTGSDDDGDPLSFSVTSGPSHGDLTGTAPNLTYSPNPGYYGDDALTFQVNDGRGGTAQADVDITVTEVNTDPVANADAVSVDENSAVAILLTGSDGDGDPLSFSIVTPPSQGDLSGTAPNMTYTPDADYFGPDSFTFRVQDGRGGSSTADVSITVDEVVAANIPPVANPDSVSVDEDDAVAIVLTGSDADDDPLSYAVLTPPSHGSIQGTAPNLTYTPNDDYFGSDALTFQVSDGRGGSAQAVVEIEVDSVNDAPIATGAVVAATSGAVVNILLSASDIDSGALTYQIASTPSNGALGSTADGDNQVTYQSTPGFVGTVEFTFTANDGSAPSNIATVTINVEEAPTSRELFSDDFERADGASVGNGWTELETAGGATEISSGRLWFRDTSDLVMRPSVSHGFAPTSTGTLTWSYTMDWTRDRKEGVYRVFMQLGSSASMNANDRDAGVGVNLVWSRLGGVHETLGIRNGGSETGVAQVSGETTIEVTTYLDAGTYEVRINGVLAAGGVPLSSGGPLDTVRFATDGLNEVYFSGRSFDDVSIVAE